MTVEVYAGDFFRLFEAILNTKFCDMCSRRFNRTFYYKHKNSNIHLAPLFKKTSQSFSS